MFERLVGMAALLATGMITQRGLMTSWDSTQSGAVATFMPIATLTSYTFLPTAIPFAMLIDFAQLARVDALSDVPKSGSEIRLSTDVCVGDQTGITLAASLDGGFIGCWENSNTNSDCYDPLLNRYSANGTYLSKNWGYRPNGGDPVTQTFMTNLYSGITVMSFQAFQGPIIAAFTTDSDRVWNGKFQHYGNHIAMAPREDGGFTVVYEKSDGSSEGVFAWITSKTYGSVDREFAINNEVAGVQKNVMPIDLSANKMGFTFESPDSSGAGIYFRAFDDYRSPVSNAFRVNQETKNDQINPATVVLTQEGNGPVKLLTVWQSFLQDGSKYAIVGRQYYANGTMITDEFIINSQTQGSQQNAAAAAFTGGFGVMWDTEEEGSTNTNVMIKLFDNNNNAITAETRANTYTRDSQRKPKLLTLVEGDLVGAWESYLQLNTQSGWDVYGQVFQVPFTANNANQTLNLLENAAPTHLAPISIFSRGSSLSATFTLSMPMAGRVSVITVDKVTSSYDMNTGVLSVSGPLSALNKAFESLQFAPMQYYFGNLTIAVRITNNVSPALTGTVNINVQAVNDAPLLSDVSTNVSYEEGKSAVALSSNLNVMDIDNTSLASAKVAITAGLHNKEDVLAFTSPGCVLGSYNNVSGELTLTGNCAIALYRTALRSVTYRTTEKNPAIEPRTISFTVNDGSLDSNTLSTTVNVIAVNDAPVISTNQLRINKGQRLTLLPTNLLANDVDSAASSLTFTVSTVRNMQFELISQPGAAINSFTKEDLENKQVIVVHDGSMNAPSYQITVSDGVTSSAASTATITYSNNNVAPQMNNNRLTITEGGQVLLNSVNVLASDVDNAANQLTFSVSNVQGGYFETIAGVRVSSFLQQQVSDGQIRFVHDGGEDAPQYQLTVTDSVLTSSPLQATVAFNRVNDAPRVVKNRFTVIEGGYATLSMNNLNVIDDDNQDPVQLAYTVSNVQHGQFELVSKANETITTFTQADVNNGQIRFVHDGSESAPSYSLSVTDGIATTLAMGVIDYTPVNDAPKLDICQFDIVEGAKFVVTSEQLNALDDTPDSDITYKITDLVHGQFERVMTPGVQISSFTQKDVKDKKIVFVHDNSLLAPSFSVTVSDGKLSTASQAAAIRFMNVNHAPTVIGKIADKVVTAGQAFDFDINVNETFADPDQNDVLTLSSTREDGTSLPMWLTMKENKFIGVAPVSAVGLFGLKVIAKDKAGSSVSASFILSVASAMNGMKEDDLIFGMSQGEFAAAVLGAIVACGIAGAGGIYAFFRNRKNDRALHAHHEVIVEQAMKTNEVLVRSVSLNVESTNESKATLAAVREAIELSTLPQTQSRSSIPSAPSLEIASKTSPGSRSSFIMYAPSASTQIRPHNALASMPPPPSF